MAEESSGDLGSLTWSVRLAYAQAEDDIAAFQSKMDALYARYDGKPVKIGGLQEPTGKQPDVLPGVNGAGQNVSAAEIKRDQKIVPDIDTSKIDAGLRKAYELRDVLTDLQRKAVGLPQLNPERTAAWERSAQGGGPGEVRSPRAAQTTDVEKFAHAVEMNGLRQRMYSGTAAERLAAHVEAIEGLTPDDPRRGRLLAARDRLTETVSREIDGGRTEEERGEAARQEAQARRARQQRVVDRVVERVPEQDRAGFREAATRRVTERGESLTEAVRNQAQEYRRVTSAQTRAGRAVDRDEKADAASQLRGVQEEAELLHDRRKRGPSATGLAAPAEEEAARGLSAGQNLFSLRGLGHVVGSVTAAFAVLEGMRLTGDIVQARRVSNNPDRLLDDMSQPGELHDPHDDAELVKDTRSLARLKGNKLTVDAVESIPLVGSMVLRPLDNILGGSDNLDRQTVKTEQAIAAHQKAVEMVDAAGDFAASRSADVGDEKRRQADQLRTRATNLWINNQSDPKAKLAYDTSFQVAAGLFDDADRASTAHVAVYNRTEESIADAGRAAEQRDKGESVSAYRLTRASEKAALQGQYADVEANEPNSIRRNTLISRHADQLKTFDDDSIFGERSAEAEVRGQRGVIQASTTSTTLQSTADLDDNRGDPVAAFDDRRSAAKAEAVAAMSARIDDPKLDSGVVADLRKLRTATFGMQDAKTGQWAGGAFDIDSSVGRRQVQITQRQQAASTQGDYAVMAAELNHDPLEAQLQGVRGHFNTATAGMNQGTQQYRDLLADERVEEQLDKQKHTEQGTRITENLSTQKVQLDALLGLGNNGQPDETKAQAAGTLNDFEHQAQDLSRAGFKDQAGAAMKNGIEQLQLEKRDFLNDFHGVAVDAGAIDFSNPRNTVDLRHAVGNYDKAITDARGFNPNDAPVKPIGESGSGNSIGDLISYFKGGDFLKGIAAEFAARLAAESVN